MFMTDVFTVPGKELQPRCASTEAWMKKECCIYKMKVVAAVRKVKYGICRKIDTIGNPYVKQNMPDSKREILHVFSHIQNLDLKQCACVFTFAYLHVTKLERGS